MDDYSFERHRSVLFDGNVVVFATGTGEKLNFQVRIKLPSSDGYAIRKSLKTSIEHEAIHIATELYLDARARYSQGISLLKNSWGQLVEQYLATRSSKKYCELFRAINKRYFEKFFSTYEDIERITSEDVRSFWEWRLEYWINNPPEQHIGIASQKPTYIAIKPAYSTIQKEASYLRSVLRYAFNAKLMPTLPAVYHPYKKDSTKDESHLLNRKRRASFTQQDYKKLSAHIASMCANPKDTRTSSIRAKEALRCAVLLIANGAIRPMELYRVRFGQMKLENIAGENWSTITLSKYQSKTNRPRVIAFEGGDNPYVYVQRYREFAKWANDDDLIMASDSDREKPRDLSYLFSKYTQKWGIGHDDIGRKRTLYSLRHYCIEQMLIRGIPPMVVAKLAGHSVATLVSFYDETGIMMYLDELNKNRKIYPKLSRDFSKLERKDRNLKIVT